MARIGSSLCKVGSAVTVIALCLGMSSCSDGGTGKAQLVSLFVTPTTQVVDAGQTTTIMASITNDGTPGGATFSVSGGGTLSSASTTTVGATENVSVSYTAPATATTATVTATSVAAPSQKASVAITVNPALVITTVSLPAGSTGTTYDVVPSATGGTGTLTWSLSSGSLPTGLSLNAATGEISGTPTSAATSTFTLAVTDSAPTPMTAVRTFSIVINPPVPVITAVALPVAVVGTAYNQQLAYTGGGIGTAVWAISSGSLPAGSGLTLSSSGLISGTAVTAGQTYTFSVTVTVGTQTSAPVALMLKTVTPLVVTTASLPSGHINVAYSQQLTYMGGDGSAAAWQLVSGALPSTLTLNSSGLLSGTPVVSATYTIGVAVTVGSQTSPTKSLTLSVVSTQISSSATASGEVGLPFAFQVTALGGTTPYTYSLAAGSNALPPGLSISASTGLISGTPSTNVGSPFSGVVMQATDSLGAVGTQSMMFTIAGSRGSAANAELSGQYALLLTGFDAAGNPVDSVGSFTADGSGHVTSGVLDVNGTAMAAPQSNVALSASSYAVGSDGRGQITLTTASGSTTYVLAVNSLSGGVAGAGSMTEFDATGRRLSGQFVKQTPSAFNVASINSGFAIGAYGFAAGSMATSMMRAGTIGEVQFAGSSAVTSSEILSNTSSPTVPVVPIAGTLTVGTNGRGTLSLVLPSGGTMNFAVYVVSASRMLLLSSDAASGSGTNVRALLAGDATAQTIANGAFTASSLMGTSVFHEERLVPMSATTYASDVQVGVYTFDGAGNLSGSEDRNDAGVASQAFLTGSYAVAPNGRVTAQIGASGLGGCLDCARPQSVFYLSGAGQGYSLDYSVAGGTGSFEAQTAGSLSGAYSLETDGTLTAAALPESGLVTATGSAVTGLLDQAAAGALAPAVAVSGTVSTGSMGRVALTSGANGPAVVYMISPTRGFWLDTADVAPALRVVNHQ